MFSLDCQLVFWQFPDINTNNEIKERAYLNFACITLILYIDKYITFIYLKYFDPSYKNAYQTYAHMHISLLFENTN